MSGAAPNHRPVRSFVRRAGRLTTAQQRALEKLWPTYGIDYTAAQLDLDRIFGRHAPVVVEIGFGDGEALVAAAAAAADTDFIGIDVHPPGVGHCLLHLERRGLDNVRLIRHDAVEVLREQVPDAALSQVRLFFPDPWPKKRHHKRRIVQPEFVALLARKIAPGGRFHVATDWKNYAEHIARTMDQAPGFEPAPPAGEARPETKFELRGKRLGHQTWERTYLRGRRL
jgi:tRNA (guanine-N7-)-methyltransferase